MFTLPRALLAFVVIGFLLLPSLFAAEIIKTEASGRSSLDAVDPEKEALRDAFRNALEKEIGVQVKAETEVANLRLVKDRILTKAEGYVKNWKMLEPPKKESGQFLVRISVEVFQGEVNKELLLNGIDVNQVYDWIGKPRLLVLVADEINGKASGTNYARNRIEDVFISRGIRVMSSELLDQTGIFATYSADKILALGQKVRAEVIISGKCISNFSREIPIGDYKQRFYTSSLQIQTWNISNKELLFSKTFMDCNRGTDVSAVGDADAVKNSMKDCIEKAAPDIVFETVKHWHASVNRPKTYTLSIRNIEHDAGTELETQIKNIKGVHQLIRRAYQSGVLEVEVEVEGGRAEFIKSLSLIKNPRVKILSEAEYTISCEVMK